MKIVFYYICAISLLSVVLCVVDKIHAMRRLRRISESTLMTLSFLGGSVAMYLTMRIIHHKTRHNKFMLGIPLMIIMQLVAIVAISYFL